MESLHIQDQRVIELLNKLSNCIGVSGNESQLLNIVLNNTPNEYKVTKDSLNNIYLVPDKINTSFPTILVEAHGDEVGLMVKSLNNDGTINALPIGGINQEILPGSDIVVLNSDCQKIHGVIASSTPHFLKEKCNNTPNTDIIVDVGATSICELEQLYRIEIGNYISFDSKFNYDTSSGTILGKAFDNRVGCLILLNIISHFSSRPNHINVVGLISSQEEVGDRGVRYAMKNISADIAITLEGAPADDTIINGIRCHTKIKHGPMMRCIDRSFIVNFNYYRWVLDVARKNNIALQCAARTSGGTTAAVINNEFAIPAVVISVPVRYPHTSTGICSIQDIYATIELVKAIICDTSYETIHSF